MSILAACMMLSPMQVMAHEHESNVVVSNPEKDYGDKVTGQWVQYGSKWAFKKSDGEWCYYGWYEIGGKTYYFDEDGWMLTGWLRVGTESGGYLWNYYDPSGVEASGWRQIGGKWYYFDPDDDNCMAVGDTKIDGDWYMFDDSGAMVTGWFSWGDGTWGYSDTSGREIDDGWIYDGGRWYYIEDYEMLTGPNWVDDAFYGFGNDGALVYNQWGYVADYGVWYYVTGDGTLFYSGWLNDHGTWYYFIDFTMQQNCVSNIGGTVYGFRPNGAMAKGWLNVSNKWYYFDPSGIAHNGWLLDGNTWYYIKSNGEMVTGNYTINGKVEQFSLSGAWLG